jgi:type VI protein secretion system component VasK
MMTDENYSGVRQARRTTLRTFFPLIGLILMIAYGAIAWAFAPSLSYTIQTNVATIPPDMLQYLDLISGGIIFLVLLLMTTLLYASAAPKPKRQVSENQLDKERKERIAAEVERKKRQRQVRTKMAEERRKQAVQDPRNKK